MTDSVPPPRQLPPPLPVSPSGRAALLDRREQRDFLLRITQVMTARLDLREVLARVARFAVDLTGARAAAIALRQPDGGMAIVASYRLDGQLDLGGTRTAAVDREGGAARPGPWTGEVAPGSATLPADLLDPEALPRHVVALPLVFSGETIGQIFVVRPRSSGALSTVDGPTLRAFADQAAVAIANARLYGEKALQADELRRLHDLSLDLLRADSRTAALGTTAHHALGIGPSEWAVVTAARDSATPAVAGHGPSHSVALTEATRRVLSTGATWVPDADTLAHLEEEGFAGAAAVPVLVAGATVAALFVAARTPGRYSRDALDLLETAAGALGLALARFDLVEQLATGQQQLAAIIAGHPSGILLLDPAGRVAAANPAAARLLDRPAASLAGLPVDDVVALVDEQGRRVSVSRPREGTPAADAVHGTLALDAPGLGKAPYVRVTVQDLPGVGGRPGAFLVEIVDLTALKETENAKSVFLAGLSHELKTPLALIQGYAETLSHPGVRGDDELYRQGLAVIVTETEHLTTMVDRLLLAARLEAGAVTIERDDVDLTPLVRGLVDEFRRVHPDRAWTAELPPSLVAWADATQIREVFQNLLSNAAKFTPPGSAVRVTGRPSAGHVEIAVADEGIGIADRDRERIFERFYRASGNIEGTGLGLYMSRAIVEAHQGRLTVESAPGRGSRFVVTLPAGEAAA